MIRRGGSLHGWCAANGVNPGFMYQIIAGYKRGPRCMQLLQKLCKETGMKHRKPRVTTRNFSAPSASPRASTTAPTATPATEVK